MISPALSRKLRWFLVALLGLLLVVIVLAEVLPWNFLKGPIAERVQAATGRSLTIAGDITVNLLPKPRITLHNVSLDNPDWATADAMVRIERISAEPALAPLLRGQVDLGRVEVESPSMNLENRSSNAGNWSFSAGEAVPQPQNGGKSSPLFTISHLQVTDATLSYRPAGGAPPIVVSSPLISIAEGREGIRGSALLVAREQTFRLEAKTDSLDAWLDDSRSFQGNVSISSDDSKLTTSLVLPESPSLSHLEADPALEIQNLAAWADWLGVEPVNVQAVDVAAQLERQQSRWALTDIEAVLLDSHITGELAVDTSGEVAELSGRLHAPQFDIAELQAAWPAPESPDRAGISIPVLPALRGGVSLAIDRLVFAPLVTRDFEAQLHFGKHEIGLNALRFAIAGGRGEGHASLTSNSDVVMADTQLSLTNLAVGTPGTEAGEGQLDVELDVELEAVQQQQYLQPALLLEHLQIEQATGTYTNEDNETRFKALLEVSPEGVPVVSLAGKFRDHPVEGEIEGATLTALAEGRKDYPVEARISSAGVEGRIETRLGSILDPQTLSAQISLTADSTNALEPWLGHALPPMNPVHLSASLDRDHEQWILTGLEAQAGESDVTGDLRWHNEDPPNLQADLKAEKIDLSALLAGTGQNIEAPARDLQTTETNVLAFLRMFDGRIDLNADLVVLPDDSELNDFTLNASLDGAHAETEVLHFKLAGGSVRADLSLNASRNLGTWRIDADFEDIVLRKVGETFTPLEERLGSLSGALHLELTQPQTGELQDDLLLPYIGRVKLNASFLRFENAEAQTDLRLQLQTQGLSEADQVIHVEGEGYYDGEPVSVRFRGDPLLNARDLDRPYRIDLEAEVVKSNISLQGTILRPFSLEGLDLELAMEGPNPQELSRLFGVPLPPLPPYAVSGNLMLKQERWTLTDMKGRVGESDIAGWLGLDPGVSPPRITGDLSSESLYLGDLGGLIGAAPGHEAENTDSERPGRIIPDEPIIGDAWRSVSADVRYRADSVRAMDTPFSKVAIDFLLEDGRGTFDPLSFGLGGGRVDFRLDLDATAQPPEGTAYVEIRQVDLRDVLEAWALTDESVGIVGGQGKFWVRGASVAELFGSADGGMIVLMTEGRLDALLVELAGLDAGQSILSWLRDRDPVPIDCAYADIQARGGMAEVDTFIIDTGDTLFTAGGEVNLDTETLDLTVQAHPKDPSMFVGRTPLHLGGTFGDMEVSLHGEELAARVGASAVLAAIAGPIAALLPFLELGTGEDSGYCKGLVSRTSEAIGSSGDDE